MRGRLAALLLAAGLCACLSAGTAAADQTDSRLDGLFEELQAAPDATAASRIDARIWRIWLQNADERAAESVLIGVAFMNGGRLPLAEIAFTEAIERAPDFAEAWNKRATLRYYAGDLEGSVADCAHVLKLEPRHFGAMSGLGMIAMDREDWAAAERWFDAALNVHPHLPGAEEGRETARRRRLGKEI